MATVFVTQADGEATPRTRNAYLRRNIAGV
jgi:hypothetical protein